MRPAMVALRPSKRRDVMGTSVGTKRSQEKPGEARKYHGPKTSNGLRKGS